MDDYFKLGVGVSLMLLHENEILLQLRQGTGFADGLYGLVGGYIDGQESTTTALIREAQEEVGITIKPQDLRFSSVMHRRAPDNEFIILFYTCNVWQGDVQNNEPDMCKELRFFPINDLPKNISGLVRKSIQNMQVGTSYCEYGWDEVCVD